MQPHQFLQPLGENVPAGPSPGMLYAGGVPAALPDDPRAKLAAFVQFAPS